MFEVKITYRFVPQREEPFQATLECEVCDEHLSLRIFPDNDNYRYVTADSWLTLEDEINQAMAEARKTIYLQRKNYAALPLNRTIQI